MSKKKELILKRNKMNTKTPSERILAIKNKISRLTYLEHRSSKMAAKYYHQLLKAEKLLNKLLN
jgi:hypothetical protein